MKIGKHDEVGEGAKETPTRYKVGYGKPPKNTQFKKGRSGNPAGRPKGSKNKLPDIEVPALKDIVLKEAYRKIDVRDGNETITVPMAEAVIRATAVKAAKGYVGSARLFTEMLNEVEAAESALKFEAFKTFADYKRNAENELARRQKLGIVDDGKTILPHPDDVIINPRTTEARIAGPMTEDEWDTFAEFAQQKETLLELLPDLEAQLKRSRNKDTKAFLREDLAQIDRRLKLINECVPNAWIERERKHWTSE